MEEYKDRYGKLHREDGPAVIRPDGRQEWWVHGRRHSEDGPAVVCLNGTQLWYFHNELHREDGPAVTWSDGTRQWWVHGKEVDPMKHLVLIGTSSRDISDEK